MREIKYRAWLKNEHKMVEVAEISWVDRNIIYLLKNSNTYYEALFDEIELMQYTGLKDENGTEIYEGDIIDCENICVVMWLKECARFIKKTIIEKVYDSADDGNLHGCSNWATVIGNIYENPELMEV